MTNPLRELRDSLSPTTRELEKRCTRDQGRPHLLQRELARRIGCSKYCIEECEQNHRFPANLVYRVNAMTLFERNFELPFDDGGPSLDETRKQLDKALKKA